MSSRTDLKVSLRRKVHLDQYTTMQVGGLAEHFAEPTNEEELIEALEFSRQENIPFVVLGKGSNVIFSDEGFDGLVISMLHYEKGKILFDKQHMIVTVGSGVHLYKLALAARNESFGGVEFLSGIPGTLGGALVMNAGFSRFPGQINEIGDLVREVAVLHYDGRKEIRHKDDVKFSYRYSSLRDCVVLEAKLQLWHRPSEEIEKEIRANFDYRNHEQDMRYPSSGSIFKNPGAPLPSAGRLIDLQGLKGTRIGGMMVSPKHGNFFIKVGPTKSSDVKDLIQKIQKAVFDATNVLLEPEVRIIERP